MSTLKEYLTEAHKIISKDKKKVGNEFHHEIIVKTKKKVAFDDIANEVGYHPIAYGIRKSKVNDLGDGTFKYTFITSKSAD